MKQILKKNQIIISVIAIMLIAAGYMNYTSNEKQALETAVLTDSEKYAGIGDATLVSANVADNNDLVNNNEGQNITDDSTKNEDEIKSNEQNTENKENDKNTVQNEINTSTTVTENSGYQYFAELRLERDKMYSQMLESYQKILSNSQISETQKEISENEIKKISRYILEIERENLAYKLRSELKDGDICPVCGSAHHHKENIKHIEFKESIKFEEEKSLKEKCASDLDSIIKSMEAKIKVAKEKIE